MSGSGPASRGLRSERQLADYQVGSYCAGAGNRALPTPRYLRTSVALDGSNFKGSAISVIQF